MENIVVESFMTSLKKFKEMNIQDAIGFGKWNEMFISHHSTSLKAHR